MNLQLHSTPAWHWAVAGLAIATITLVLQVVGKRSLGLSSGLEDLCSLASNNPIFARTAAEGRSWRLPFLGGLLAGGVVSALWAGGWSPTWAIPALDAHLPTAGKVALLFVGGVCTGYGVRLAGGCTSGHGIFGMARFQWSSIRTTCTFMAVGVVTANLLYRVGFA